MGIAVCTLLEQEGKGEWMNRHELQTADRCWLPLLPFVFSLQCLVFSLHIQYPNLRTRSEREWTAVLTVESVDGKLHVHLMKSIFFLIIVVFRVLYMYEYVSSSSQSSLFYSLHFHQKVNFVSKLTTSDLFRLHCVDCFWNFVRYHQIALMNFKWWVIRSISYRWRSWHDKCGETLKFYSFITSHGFTLMLRQLKGAEVSASL